MDNMFAAMDQNPFLEAWMEVQQSDLSFEDVAAQLRNPANRVPDDSSANMNNFVNQWADMAVEYDETDNDANLQINLRDPHYTA